MAMMRELDIAQQLMQVRIQAEQLVSQLGADPALATPLLAALSALEQAGLGASVAEEARPAPLASSQTPRLLGAASPAAEAWRDAEDEIYQLYHVLMDLPMGVCILEGPEQRYSFANPAYEQLAGRREIVGKTLREVFPELEGQGIYELLEQVYLTGKPFVSAESMIQLDRRGDGQLEDVYFQLTFLQLCAADGARAGVVVYAIDIGDRRALERERARVLELSEAAVVVRDQFLSIAAHEIKTPLTSLLSYFQLLERRLIHARTLDERSERTLKMIGLQSRRLNRLIDTLLDVARINMGHLSLERAPLDLRELTARVVDEIGVTFDLRTIQVSTSPQACPIFGDSLRLEQVIVNLVQNAVKYSPAGEPVQVRVWAEPSHACVSVQDRGIGIPAEAIPQLFNRFYRVTEGAAGAIPGMGIGLSVVKEIVTLHGGDIRVDSAEGVGSTFTVCLPLEGEARSE